MSIREIPGVQNPVVRYARSLGWTAWKMKIEGIRGCPDVWFFRNKQLVIIEFKATGKSREMSQILRARDLERQGFTVHVIDNADAGRALFDNMEGEL